MKSKIKQILIFLLITIILLTMNFLIRKEDKVLENKVKNNTNFISMMIEQEDGTYKENTAMNLVNKGYMFNPEASGCENGGKLSWNKEKEKIEASLITSDKCYAYFDKYDFTKSCMFGYEDNLACELIKNKDNTLIYHDGKCDYEEEKNCELEAGDNNYRYAGADEDVNNYVCFGSDEENCPEDNLFRIIGIFDGHLKLIKSDFASKEMLGTGVNTPTDIKQLNSETDGSYSNVPYNESTGSAELKDAFAHIYKGKLKQVDRYTWQENNNSIDANWPTALLNKIHLNINFLKYIGNNNLIEEHAWIYANDSTMWDTILINGSAKITYDNEIGTKALNYKTYQGKVGLMYISDYLYSAISNNWHLKPSNGIWTFTVGPNDENGIPTGTHNGADGTDYRSTVDDNWLHIGLWEWTITQRKDSNNLTYSIAPPGNVGNNNVGNHYCGVRPVFYLVKEIKKVSGSGLITDPYRIA